MTEEQYSIFDLKGGLGKHIAATAVAKCIKNNHPERKLIVACAYPDIFINLPFVDRVYRLGQTSYFYQTYIENKDSLVFSNEPYLTTDHIHKKLPLVQTWCKMYGLKYQGEAPELTFNKLQIETSKRVWVTDDKPLMVLHTNGGLIGPNAKPYLWARDMPFDVAKQIYERYNRDYNIYQCTKANSEKIPGARVVQWDDKVKLSTLEFLSVILHSQKRVLIDSSLQHAAAALGLPSVVLWNGTSPKVFGHDLHTNLETVKPQNFKLPGSYLFDFDFNGTEHEYPFVQQESLFDIDKVFEAIETT